MAEPGVIAARPLLLQALTVLNTTRRTLDPPGASEADLDRHAADVDQAAQSLASLARDDTCPPKLEVALFDWRDRLGSHVLAAAPSATWTCTPTPRCSCCGRASTRRSQRCSPSCEHGSPRSTENAQPGGTPGEWLSREPGAGALARCPARDRSLIIRRSPLREIVPTVCTGSGAGAGLRDRWFVLTYRSCSLTKRSVAERSKRWATPRRAIFELLARGPMPVRALADALPVSRPAVSQHLKVLKRSGLVLDRAEGTRRIYRVDPSGVAAMRQYLERMWDTALVAFAAAAENEPEPTKGTDR